MKNIYAPMEIVIIPLEDYDCICTSLSDREDYNENELPLVPFKP